MSIALTILGQVSDVTAAIHGESLTLQPMGRAVTGYAQELSNDPDAKGDRRHPSLHTGADTITHIIHVRRSDLKDVTLSAVAAIVFGTKTYRVQHFTDDPMTPETDFYCRIV